jgi:SAM-dependent methyltransferase
VAIGKEIARARRLGLLNYAQYRRLRLRNRIFKVANLVGPERYECPCCGWRGMRFLDYVRETATVEASVCPRCRSHPRHRALVLYLNQLLSTLPERAAILHFAPERAFARAFASRPGLRYYGVDLGYRATSARADMTAIPFRANVFDLVLSSHVLEHVEYERAALDEIARVVAPGGRALIMVPMVRGWESNPTVEFGRANFQGHWRVYGRDLTDRIAAAGLQPASVRLAEHASPAERERFAIREAPLFVATKPA